MNGNAAPQLFDYVVSAVDAETIQGQTAERTVAATRSLLAAVGLSVSQVASQLPVEKHTAVKKFFS